MDKDKTYEATIKGARLMMHNEQLANPFNEYAAALREVTKKRGKSHDDHLEISRIEFQGGLYHDAKAGPFIPAHCLMKMMVMGARRRKLGKMFEQMVLVLDPVNPVEYEGPRGRLELWDAKDSNGERMFADMRLVGVNAARTLRTRPLFRDWSCTFRVRVVDGAVNGSDLESALEAAQTIGILDGRPMYAGQFVVSEFGEVTRG